MYRRTAACAYRLTSHCLGLPLGPQAATGAASAWSSLLCHPATLARAAAPFRPGLRSFCSLDVQKEMDAVNELFAEARDEIEFAKEEADTVYFNESVRTARKAVEACMSRWEALLKGLPEEERNRVVRSMGLKIAQLQAEYDEVSKLHLED
ncbi:hypothetical protein VOLCADRAFT_120328 [Volvox carteri f. nagariensis]|uniref:Uncharacterized protein n=1 Tax=Volvox carteri f. nagariensis TaxID=3068 RepID=D8TKK6_VOLCA|nr:uncharacterized protein VOLCADRAFT_120328 [Volvox carteri f. nagariensis]EFJ51904.1 hypothetical protein VOLCADRAFT_120328 [Volvox carteri f. nagariensis]|eukprot:XP_002946678.1 hypothetical protein VOLCADRAFT_120328 [Volvox carteri f. nagariensis]